jgi:uncharacterized protein (UPF0371 family)
LDFNQFGDIKNCPGYSLLLETRKWIDDIDKKVEKMRAERIEGINHLRVEVDKMKQTDYDLKEIITRLDMTIQGQEKILQGLVAKVDKMDGELHNGLIGKKASEWFYKSVGKWVIGLLLGNAFTIIALMINKF